MHDFYTSPNKSNDFKKGDILSNKYIVSDVWYTIAGERVVDKVRLFRSPFLRKIQVWFYKRF